MLRSQISQSLEALFELRSGQVQSQSFYFFLTLLYTQHETLRSPSLMCANGRGPLLNLLVFFDHTVLVQHYQDAAPFPESPKGVLYTVPSAELVTSSSEADCFLTWQYGGTHPLSPYK